MGVLTKIVKNNYLSKKGYYSSIYDPIALSLNTVRTFWFSLFSFYIHYISKEVLVLLKTNYNVSLEVYLMFAESFRFYTIPTQQYLILINETLKKTSAKLDTWAFAQTWDPGINTGSMLSIYLLRMWIVSFSCTCADYYKVISKDNNRRVLML